MIKEAADFETLNGRLRLWHGHGRYDDKVVKQTFNKRAPCVTVGGMG